MNKINEMNEIKSKTQRQIQKDQTRKLILTTAFQLFASQGFRNTKTSDIAKAAKISHGSVFAHFPTQEELLSTVIQEFGERISIRLHELAADNSNLKEVLIAHLKGLKEQEDFYTRLITESRILPESARGSYSAIQSTISFHIGHIAEKEIQDGTIKPIPLHLLFNTWVGLIHYYLMNNDLFAPGESVLERYGKELLEHYLKLIESA